LSGLRKAGKIFVSIAAQVAHNAHGSATPRLGGGSAAF
jgi:hypothetical protein